MMSEDEKFIYFIAYPYGDKSKVTVIELSPFASYQRDEWDNVNECTFHGEEGKEDAIIYARKIAKTYNLDYCMFESRYGTGDEKLYLTDEEIRDE